MQGGYRQRNNPFIIGYTPLLSRDEQEWVINTRRTEASTRYEIDLEAFGGRHTLSAGFDVLRADCTRLENGRYRVGSARRDGEVDSRAAHAAFTLRAPGGLTANGGVRFGRFSTEEQDARYASTCDTVFDTVLIDVDPGPGVILVPIQVPRHVNCRHGYALQAAQQAVWHNRGGELGLACEPAPGLTLFSGLARTFRNPNVDELLFAAAGLQPQTGTTLELGARYSRAGAFEVAATLFHMRVEDEIVYAADYPMPERNYYLALSLRF